MIASRMVRLLARSVLADTLKITFRTKKKFVWGDDQRSRKHTFHARQISAISRICLSKTSAERGLNHADEQLTASLVNFLFFRRMP